MNHLGSNRHRPRVQQAIGQQLLVLAWLGQTQEDPGPQAGPQLPNLPFQCNVIIEPNHRIITTLLNVIYNETLICIRKIRGKTVIIFLML